MSVMWKELTAEALRAKAAGDAIVILPVASMEQHGPHLPVGVDTYLCEGVCREAAERASDVETVIAPTLWCGMAEHHMAFGGTFTFDLPTDRAVLLCLLRSVERHGFRRVLIVNGHGGNIAALSAFLPDFARETGLDIRALTYFELAIEAMGPILEDQTGVMHACEAETSMMMALAPETVRTGRFGEAHGMVDARPGPLMRPVVARYRSFKDMTASGVIGDARRASAAKGEKLVAACAEALAAWLSDRGVWAG
jgi:creatinine amidohydrolase